MSSVKPVTVHAPPLVVDLKNAKAYILEAFKTSLSYHFVVVIEYNGVRSRPFTIDARTTRELATKLRVEAAKLRIIRHTLGDEFLREVVRG